MTDPLSFVADELGRLEAASLLREVRTLDSAPGAEVSLDGERLVLLSSNNYLGLATDPRVTEAAADAARRWGAGAGSARLVAGALRLHEDLEGRLARFKGTEEALLFSSGYLANLGAITALVERGDAIFSDELNHASIIDAARLSRADVHVYRHADADHLADLLRSAGDIRRKLVVTDTVFSMDGDLAPLPAITDLCEGNGAILMVDEAHASGVVGPGGRGAVALHGLEGRVQVIMGTLSKSLGSAGGYIAGRSDLISLLRNRARTFVFDTAPPPPAVAGALAALDVIDAEPERIDRVRALARRLATDLRAKGFSVRDPAAAIVPVIVGRSDEALALARAVRAGGAWVPAIRPPSVPEGTARLRATVMATHTDAHIERAVSAFAAARVDIQGT